MNLQVEMVEENNVQCFKVIGEIDAFWCDSPTWLF